MDQTAGNLGPQEGREVADNGSPANRGAAPQRRFAMLPVADTQPPRRDRAARRTFFQAAIDDGHERDVDPGPPRPRPSPDHDARRDRDRAPTLDGPARDPPPRRPSRPGQLPTAAADRTADPDGPVRDAAAAQPRTARDWRDRGATHGPSAGRDNPRPPAGDQARDDRPPTAGPDGPDGGQAPADNRAPLPLWDVLYDFPREHTALIRTHYRVEPIRTSHHPHTHGFMALGRAVAEHRLVQHLAHAHGREVRILDVGGNPRRHASRSRSNVHCACPVLDAIDLGRQISFPRNEAGVPIGWCQCRGEACTCNEYDVAIGIHAIYYLDPETVERIIMRTRLRRFLVVAHVFPDMAGTFISNEAFYFRTDSHSVEMKVNNERGYYHDATDWLSAGYAALPGGRCLVVRRPMPNFGDHHVFDIRVGSAAPPAPRPVPLSLALSMSETGTPVLALPSSTPNVVAGFTGSEYRNVAISKVTVFRGTVFTYGREDVCTPISASILAMLVTEARLKDRSHPTLRVLHQRAKELYRQRVPYLPPLLQSDASLVSAVLALTESIPLENSLLARAMQVAQPILKANENLLSNMTAPASMEEYVARATSFAIGGVAVYASARFGLFRLAIRIISIIRRLLAFTARPSGPVPLGANLLPGLDVTDPKVAFALRLYMIIGAPLLEENVKRFMATFVPIRNPTAAALIAGWIFGIYEFFERLRVAPNTGLMQVSVAISHGAWAALPYQAGVAVHALNNIWALAANADVALTHRVLDDLRAYVFKLPLAHPELQTDVLSVMLERVLKPVLLMCQEHARQQGYRVPTASLLDNVPMTSRVAFALLLSTYGPRAMAIVADIWTARVPTPTASAVEYPPYMIIPGETAQAPPKFRPTTTKGEFLRVIFACAARLRRPILKLRGIGLSGIYPSYYAINQETERSAILGRLLIERAPDDVDAWALACQLYDASPARRLLLEDGPVEYTGPVAYERWIAHYPSARKRLDLRTARDELGFRALSDEEELRSMFPKGERRIEYVFEEPETNFRRLGTARSIIGSGPHRLNRTGPFHHAKGLRMQEKWRGESPVLFGACSTEVFAAWFTYWYYRLGCDVYFACHDTVRQDAHYGRCAINAEIRAWKQEGLHGSSLTAALSGRTFTARSRNGLLVRVKYRRASGDAATSVGNTEQNVRVATYAFHTTAWVIGENAAMAVAGDDNSAMSSAPLDMPLFAARSKQLGFPVTGFQSRDLWDFEFCSKLMYPSADGFMPAPKLGRFLTKTGWLLEKANDDYRSSIAVYLDDMYHVPFAREYCETLLRLLPLTKRKRVVTEDYKMHVSRRHDRAETIWDFLDGRYGLTRADHAEFCALLDSVTALPALIQVPWAHRVLIRDE